MIKRVEIQGMIRNEQVNQTYAMRWVVPSVHITSPAGESRRSPLKKQRESMNPTPGKNHSKARGGVSKGGGCIRLTAKAGMVVTVHAMSFRPGESDVSPEKNKCEPVLCAERSWTGA